MGRDIITKRTTLTLPADSLELAERVAQERKVTLSAVVAEALDRGLREFQSAQRVQDILDGYRRAFAGFSEEELLTLDGVILDSAEKGA